jgi:hypothetical protein
VQGEYLVQIKKKVVLLALIRGYAGYGAAVIVIDASAANQGVTRGFELWLAMKTAGRKNEAARSKPLMTQQQVDTLRSDFPSLSDHWVACI